MVVTTAGQEKVSEEKDVVPSKTVHLSPVILSSCLSSVIHTTLSHCNVRLFLHQDPF
jgi:hypothetical protein